MSIVLPEEPITDVSNEGMTVLPYGVKVCIGYHEYVGEIPTAICPEYLLNG